MIEEQLEQAAERSRAATDRPGVAEAVEQRVRGLRRKRRTRAAVAVGAVTAVVIVVAALVPNGDSKESDVVAVPEGTGLPVRPPVLAVWPDDGVGGPPTWEAAVAAFADDVFDWPDAIVTTDAPSTFSPVITAVTRGGVSIRVVAVPDPNGGWYINSVGDGVSSFRVDPAGVIVVYDPALVPEGAVVERAYVRRDGRLQLAASGDPTGQIQLDGVDISDMQAVILVFENAAGDVVGAIGAANGP